jgi:glycosyltransferase involved in cell wall biosynthesis
MLSVIIPTRNRAELLRSALLSLQPQTLAGDLFEVLIIDNGSTDNVRQVVTSFQGRLRNVRYFFDATPGLHVGRHLGMKMSKSDNLVYADDDIEAFPTWLEGIAESFQDEKVVLVGGKCLPKFGAQPPDWIVRMWERDEHGNRVLGYLSILDLGDEKKEINPCHVYGCNFAIRKAVLLEAGGFHPDAMPQELILFRGDGESSVSQYILEKGYKTVYNPKASVYHSVPENRLTEDYFCRRAYNQGISDSYTEIRKQCFGAKEAKSREKWLKYYYRRVKKMSISELYCAVARKLRSKYSLKPCGSHGEIEKKISDSYRNGRHFHEKTVKNDPELLEYVLRPTYF